MLPNALAIMLKAPVPGEVKTRLCPPLTHKEAAGLYGCFIKDVFGKVGSLEGVDVYAAYTPDNALEQMTGLIPSGIRSFPQEGRDLGERMYNVFKHLFSKGHRNVAIIGSDIPDLPPEYLKDAFRALEEGAGCVFGPAKDGGYYLIGMDRLIEAPFTGIPWSTGATLEVTLAKMRENSIGYALISPWHDIDFPEDLAILKENPLAPASSGFLRKIALNRL